MRRCFVIQKVRASMLAALVGIASVVPVASGQETVTVVATTDVHGHVMHWDYVTDREAPWGLTRAATVVDSIRREVGDRVILVDAGDLLQGNLFGRFFGTVRRVARHPVVDALNALRYDAFTPGNHDFDFGVAFLDTSMAYAQFNVVSANVYGANRLVFREYVTVARGGVRVGITGGTTFGTALWNRDQLRNSRVIRPPVPEIQRALVRMQADGIDLKIVLLHSGLSASSTPGARDLESENIATQLAYLPIKPDIVVLGHSHQMIHDSVINGVHFMQPEPWARSLAVARVTLDRGDGARLVPQSIRSVNLPLADVPPDDDLGQRLSDAHAAVRAWGALPLGTAPDGWQGVFSRAMDTPLVDFVNHVQLVATGAQLSATPAFTTTGGFEPGLVRVRDVHGVYPYENTLKVVQISGNALRQYLEHSATYYQTYASNRPAITSGFAGYNYDMIEGVDYVLDVSMPPGARVRQLTFDGRVVQPNDQFSLAVNSYRLVAGGYEMLGGLRVIEEFERSVFDLLVEEVRRVGTLVTESYFDPTWTLVPEAAARAVRIAFGAQDSSALERRAFRVIATSDFHGAIHPRVTGWSDGKLVGGLGALGGWVDSLAAECSCPTLLVDAGGALGGTLAADRSFGSVVIDAMNALRYDAAVVGESELFWGVDTLRARIAGAAFPWLAANTRVAGSGNRPDWARDWVMIERGGVSVAIVGLTGGASSAIALAEPERFITTDMEGAVHAAIRQARASGADHVVVLAHAEAYCDGDGCRGELIEFMERLEPGSVDLVVGGHSGSEAVTAINGIPLLLPGSEGVSLGVSDVLVAPGGSSRAISTIKTVWVDSVRTNDVAASLAAAASPPTDSVVTTAVLPVTAGGEDSRIGRLIADAYRNAARAQVAIVHNSVISGGLPAGDVTYQDVYDVQPVRHTIHRMLVRGDVIREAFEHLLRGATPTAHVSGVEIDYDPLGRPGNRIRRIRLSGDRGFGDGEMYWLAVSDFMARGGGGYAMLPGHQAESVGVSDFQALANFLSLLPRPLDVPATPRLRARR